MKLKSLNPAKNYQVIGNVEISTSKDIKSAVKKARQATSIWAETSIEKRTKFIEKFQNLLSENKENIAKLISKEMGKPIRESRDDIDSDLGYLDI